VIAAITASTPLIAAMLWVTVLLMSPGSLAPLSVLLVGIGLIAPATTAVVGMIVTGGRWAWRLGLVVIGLCAVLASTTPIDVWWVVALVVTSLSLVALLSPPVTGSLRRLHPATGPPPRAVLIPLVLLGFPFALGLAAGDSPNVATSVVGLSAPLTALWYARVLPLGLLGVRSIWPLLAIGLSLAQTTLAGTTSALGGAVMAILAWHSSVRVAFHPPRETGTALPIPPELAPRDVLDAAQLDDRGRPKT
jgi:hypothetical protein